MSTLLKVENLNGGYEKNDVLGNVSFDVGKGEFLGIIGPNGSGKSTLLKLITRVIYPTSGNVLFEGKNIYKIKLKELCKKIAFVSQDTVINFPFSVWEVVLMGRIPYLNRMQAETKQDFLIAEKSLAQTKTGNLKYKIINQLSAGERQRVIIAKALTQEPALLFLDEPTAHLDIGYQAQIMALLKELNAKVNLTVVMVLHDLNLASEYCNRIILLNNGTILGNDIPEVVLTQENMLKAYKADVQISKNPSSLKPWITVKN